MKKIMYLIVGALLITGAWGLQRATTQSQNYLGDTGIPSNYNETMKDFASNADFDALVEQLPSYFNWKDQGVVTPAKNQGSCGSCWAFASTGAFESKIIMGGGSTYDLSEWQQVLCNTAMSGCSGGSMSSLRYWETIGPMLETCTGYEPRDDEPCSSLDSCSKLSYNTTNYYTVDTSDTNQVKTSLYNDGPTYFRFDVHSDFDTFWSSASPGDVYVNTTSNFRGGHAVLIIGWDDARNAWLCKNSWGQTAGPNGDGTFWIAYSGHSTNLWFGMANVEIIGGGFVCKSSKDTNMKHVAAGRAEIYIKYFTQYARTIGSGEDLGMYGTIYWSPTTTVSETAPGYFEKGNKCVNCISATNYNHIIANRAHRCGFFNLYACANGSNTMLGGLYTTTGLYESSPDYWVMCE